MKIDPYDNKEKHLELNESVQLRIKGVTKENSDIILRYLEDMKKAVNLPTASFCLLANPSADGVGHLEKIN